MRPDRPERADFGLGRANSRLERVDFRLEMADFGTKRVEYQRLIQDGMMIESPLCFTVLRPLHGCKNGG